MIENVFKFYKNKYMFTSITFCVFITKVYNTIRILIPKRRFLLSLTVLFITL